MHKSSELDRKIKLYLFSFLDFPSSMDFSGFSPFHWRFFFSPLPFYFPEMEIINLGEKTCPIKLLEISFHTLVSTHFPMINPICDRPPHNASKRTWKIALNHQSCSNNWMKSPLINNVNYTFRVSTWESNLFHCAGALKLMKFISIHSTARWPLQNFAKPQTHTRSSLWFIQHSGFLH